MTIAAVRTVSETDDVHVIEGLLAFGGPFNGKDSYGTRFSARTDWALDLHPAGIPVLYNHGFDPDFGLSPIGMTVPPASFRMDDDGLWVQMQLDKRHQYYATRVRPLLDQDAVGISQGSAEHSVRFDERSGEVLAWPLHEVSLTPTESNPFNVVAARSGDIISVVEAIRKDAEPVAEDEPTDDTVAVRKGARNSASDQAHIDAIHAHIVALGAAAHAQNDDSTDDDDTDAASRSGDDLPTLTIVERPDPVAVRVDIDAIASRVAAETVRKLTG